MLASSDAQQYRPSILKQFYRYRCDLSLQSTLIFKFVLILFFLISFTAVNRWQRTIITNDSR